MRKPNRVIAIGVSDLHLSHTAPVSRTDHWYEAMAIQLKELCGLKDKYKVPIICAGDIFNTWNPPPELINFALKHMPIMYAVPGQHDLPNHRYADIHKSAYWTLIEAHKVENLHTDRPIAIEGARLCGFPWEEEMTPATMQPLEGINIAVIHAYVWRKEQSFPGAPPKAHASKWRDRLKGYRVALFGDNHSRFILQSDDLTLVNCGAFMRRNSDQIDYCPMAYLIYADGKVEGVPLDCSHDILLPKEETIAKLVEDYGGFDEFLESVKTLGEVTADFIEAVEQALVKKGVSKRTAEYVTLAMEKEKK